MSCRFSFSCIEKIHVRTSSEDQPFFRAGSALILVPTAVARSVRDFERSPTRSSLRRAQTVRTCDITCRSTSTRNLGCWTSSSIATDVNKTGSSACDLCGSVRVEGQSTQSCSIRTRVRRREQPRGAIRSSTSRPRRMTDVFSSPQHRESLSRWHRPRARSRHRRRNDYLGRNRVPPSYEV